MKVSTGQLSAFIRQDIRFQGQQGIYFLYLFFASLFILLLRLLPLSARRITATLLLLSDPTVLGFFFSGVILYTEREILPSLFITPLKVETYLMSRVLSFLGLSLLLSLVILVSSAAPDLRFFWLVPGLVLSAPFFTLAGIALSLRFKDVISFLILGGLMMTLFFLPFLELLPFRTFPVYLPTRSALQFFRLALGTAAPEIYSPRDLFTTGLISLAETALLFSLCRRDIGKLLGGARRDKSPQHRRRLHD